MIVSTAISRRLRFASMIELSRPCSCRELYQGVILHTIQSRNRRSWGAGRVLTGECLASPASLHSAIPDNEAPLVALLITGYQAEGATHFLAPGKPGWPLSTPCPLFSRHSPPPPLVARQNWYALASWCAAMSQLWLFPRTRGLGAVERNSFRFFLADRFARSNGPNGTEKQTVLGELHRDLSYLMTGKGAWVAGADRREAPGPKPEHLGRRLRLRQQPPRSSSFAVSDFVFGFDNS